MPRNLDKKAPTEETSARTTSPFVVAVVLTWNDHEMAHRCIESLYQADYDALHVVLVDNGSSFPTVEPLQKAFPELETIALDRNYGFTGGCNRGISRALEMGADYVFLLNNDTVVERRAISELVTAIAEDERIAMASALICDIDDPKRVQSYQGWLYPNRAWIKRPTSGELLDDRHRLTVETEFAPACAVMFRPAALGEVGLFDERLFTNWEDYDLCLRLRKAGWKLAYVGTAEVGHRRHQTTGETSPFITYFSVRNRLICLFRHGQLPKILFNLPFILRSLCRKIRAYGWTNIECHWAFLKAVFDFVVGVRGEGKAPSNRDDSLTGKKR